MPIRRLFVLLLLGAAALGCRKPSAAPADAAASAPAPVSTAAAPDASVEARSPLAPRITIQPALGNLVAGRLTPGQLSIGWDTSGGTLVSCDTYLRADEVEGDKTLSRCSMARLDASGAAGAWAVTMPSDAQLAPFDDGGRNGRALATYVRQQMDFSQYAVALRGPRRFFYTSEHDGTGAVGSCTTSVSFFGSDPRPESLVPSCAIWQPSLAAAERAGTTVILARGIDDGLFRPVYERFQGGGESPWVTTVRDRLLFVTGEGTPSSVVWTGPRGTPVLAIGRKTLAIASIDRGRSSTVEVVLHGLPPKSGPPEHSVVVARGELGMPAIAAVPNGFVVVWAERETIESGHRLHAAQITEGGVVTELGFLTPPAPKEGPSAIAPGLAGEAGLLALTYTEERKGKESAVRFACGGADVKGLVAAAAIVSDASKRSRDSELALAPDGGAGILAWHELTKTTQGVRVAKYACASP